MTNTGNNTMTDAHTKNINHAKTPEQFLRVATDIMEAIAEAKDLRDSTTTDHLFREAWDKELNRLIDGPTWTFVRAQHNGDHNAK